MKAVGIVGAEGAKFTPVTEKAARDLCAYLLQDAQKVVSGGCHLGGVDIYAADQGRLQGVEVEEHLPRNLSWTNGYKPRNMLIAANSTEVHCITVAKLPQGYHGMRFDRCYHCNSHSHVKSGGCWTAHYAGRLGKPFVIWVIEESGSVLQEIRNRP